MQIPKQSSTSPYKQVQGRMFLMLIPSMVSQGLCIIAQPKVSLVLFKQLTYYSLTLCLWSHCIYMESFSGIDVCNCRFGILQLYKRILQHCKINKFTLSKVQVFTPENNHINMNLHV